MRPRLRRAARPRSARHCGALGRRLTDARARGARAEGIQLAAADGIDWLLHIDTDELAYPGGAPEFSLQRVLAAYPADVDTVVFPNYESLPERDDVQDPFTEARPNPDSRMRRRSGPPARGIGTLAISANPTLTAGAQVTLFKRNYHHVVSDAYFKAYHTVARGNPNYFITYGNGKSAARVQSGLRPNGAHRWYSYVKAPKCAPTALALAITLNLQGAAADGRAGGAREETSDQAAVLHFTYNRFEDLKSRRDRCDCAPTEEDAKRCFILPFDRMARPAPLLAAAAAGFEVQLWGLMRGAGARRPSWRRPCAATRSSSAGSASAWSGTSRPPSPTCSRTACSCACTSRRRARPPLLLDFCAAGALLLLETARPPGRLRGHGPGAGLTAAAARAQVLIRGFMAADDAGPAMDAAAAQLAQPPPGQAAAGASRLSVRADPLDAKARQ